PIALEFYPPSPDRPPEPFYPKSKMAKLDLTLEQWPFYVHDDPKKDEDAGDSDSFDSEEFPKTLQKRWAKKGKLYLGEMATEPIEIPLPPPPDSPKRSGLVVRGHVNSIQMTKETATDITFEIELDLKFVNTGNRPVILLRPEAEALFSLGGMDLSVVGAGVGYTRKELERGDYLRKRDW